MNQWADDNPYYLLIVGGNHGAFTPDFDRIDLGMAGWATAYAERMRAPGRWYLCRKEVDQIVLAMTVADGEQPYYTKRHIGQIGMTGWGRSAACYGIGKKRIDGGMDRLWILPDGMAVCGGDDVEALAMEVVAAMEWHQQAGAPITIVDGG